MLIRELSVSACHTENGYTARREEAAMSDQAAIHLVTDYFKSLQASIARPFLELMAQLFSVEDIATPGGGHSRPRRH